MSSERWQEVEALLDAALDLPPDAREALLDDPAAAPAEIRAEARRLLGRLKEAGDFLAEPAPEFAAAMVADLQAATGDDPAHGDVPSLDRVGPYRIIGEIARGGMGAVYLAERDDDQFRMQVALKLLPQGMASEQASRRFREERQILASLEHPCIARLLDGGVTADGTPWFAMEYVAGLPIDRYCDLHALSTEARLELFCRVCDAVQFAHRKLVAHRDLKPSNILVAEDGTPKLLDFGIAKLLDEGPEREGAAMTGTRARIMTPAYASPEQVRGQPITTASDVYSLGVLLYELLTGRRPYRVGGHSPAELESVVCDTDPPAPSLAVRRAATRTGARSTPDTEAQEGAVAAEAPSRVATDRLSRKLRGDLDTIVLMAMRKEPERRYASPDQLAADLRRHLGGYPVHARRDSGTYRAGKFLRRHRAAAAAAALILLSLVGGLAGIAWQARLVRQEAQLAAEVKNFLVSLFEAEQPELSRGREVTARELLDRGAQRVDAELAGQPAVQAELLSVLAATYMELGLLEEARPLVERSLALRREVFGERNPAVAASLHQAALLLFERGEHDDAERGFRDVLELRRSLGSRRSADVARTLNGLARVMLEKGAYDEAEALYREVLDIDRRVHGPTHLEVATGLSDLGVLLWRKADYAGAEEAHREALELRRARLDDDHPDVVTSLFNLATVRDDLGDPGAESMFREVLERRRRIYRGAHPILAVTLDNLGGLLSRRGATDEGEPYLQEALQMQRQLLGDDHPQVAAASNNLAVLNYRAGDLVAAEINMREALRIWRSAFGEAHPNVAAALNNLAGILNEGGSFHAAEPLLVEALRLRREMLGDHHPNVAQTLRNLGIALHGTGRHAAAEPLFRESLDIYRQAFADSHIRTAEVLLAFGSLLMDSDRPLEARPLLSEALAMRQEKLPPEDWRIAEAGAGLGRVLVLLDELTAAEPVLLASYRTLADQRGQQQAVSRRTAIEQLALVYDRTGRPREADRLRSLLLP